MGSKKTPEPPKPDPTQQAQDLANAQISTNPQLAQSAYDIYTNPQYGALPLTQYTEGIRQQVFPGQYNVANQLSQNVLGQLQSPTGLTPEQQQAINARRQEAQTNLISALRDRANLGGNLYGGRSALDESKQVANLQNMFSEEDINRESQARLNAIQSALPILQQLYGQQILPPQFQSTVQSPESYAQQYSSYANAPYNQALQKQQNNTQLYSALFQGLGGAAGGFLGGI